MSSTPRPKSLAERLQWMSENLPGFREELDAVKAAEVRAQLLQCISEFHQFSHPLTTNAISPSSRTRVAEIAGLCAASYLADLGGMLASW